AADAGEYGVWRYVSPQIQAILGFSPEEWCADPGLWASRLHPEDRARVIDAENQAAAGERLGSASEYRLLHPHGQGVWVGEDAQFVAADDGARCWHGVMSDITEQKEAEAELERRAAQHAAVARLGEHALEGASTSDLMQEAITSAAQLLGMEMAAVIEHVAERDRFVFRSTYGLKGNLVNRPIHGGNHS